MKKYWFRIKEEKSGVTVEMLIVAGLMDDDEAIRTAHILADHALLLGSAHVAIAVAGSDDREVAFVEDGQVFEDELDRPTKYGGGYETSHAP